MNLLLAALVGYLLGALPVGYLVGRLWGKDVRTTGSGRTGATNVFRSAGKWAAILTALGDFAKGALAVLAVRALGLSEAGEVVAGIAAVAGHNWSVFLRFTGGAGTMTNVGVLTALNPLALLVITPLGLGTLFVSRYASVASLVVAGLIPLVLFLFARLQDAPSIYVWFGIGGGLLVVGALRPNIRRLIAGSERRLNLNFGGSK